MSSAVAITRTSLGNLVVPHSQEVTILMPNSVWTPDRHSALQPWTPGLWVAGTTGVPPWASGHLCRGGGPFQRWCFWAYEEVKTQEVFRTGSDLQSCRPTSSLWVGFLVGLLGSSLFPSHLQPRWSLGWGNSKCEWGYPSCKVVFCQLDTN